MCCLACQELEDRNKCLAALADKYTVSGLAEPGPLPELAPLPEEEAIILIQANERGRQARERAQTMRTFKRQRQLEDRRARSGVVRPCCRLDQLTREQKYNAFGAMNKAGKHVTTVHYKAGNLGQM